MVTAIVLDLVQRDFIALDLLSYPCGVIDTPERLAVEFSPARDQRRRWPAYPFG